MPAELVAGRARLIVDRGGLYRHDRDLDHLEPVRLSHPLQLDAQAGRRQHASGQLRPLNERQPEDRLRRVEPFRQLVFDREAAVDAANR